MCPSTQQCFQTTSSPHKQKSIIDCINPPVNHKVVHPESSPIVLIPPVEPTTTPPISTPFCHGETDSQPPSNNETLPEVRISSGIRNPP